MANQSNNYKNTQIINNDVYAVKDGDTYWGGVTNHNFEILAELNKRPTLTITYGDVEETSMPVRQWQYSVVGNDVLIQLPRQSIPQVEHFNLIIKQDGVEVGRYNNTQEKVINLVSPEYAKIVFEKNGQVLQTYEPTGNDVTITIPDVQIDNKTLTIKQGDTVLGEFDNSENKTITIPTPAISNGTLTLKLGNNVLGTFSPDADATIVIPKQESQTAEYGTLTVTLGDDTLGTFTANSDATISIPKQEQHSISFSYDNDSIGEFNNTEDVTIVIPKEEQHTVSFTCNDEDLGQFNNTEDVTIDIPASSFNGANINVKKQENYEDLSGDTVFTTVQTVNTAENSDLNTYNLTLNVGDDTVVYNPFVESRTVNINNSESQHYTVSFTCNDEDLGQFNNTEDVTIDIPASSFSGANINVKKSEGYEDLSGDLVFTTVQTVNTAENSDLNTYNLTLNVGDDTVVYNPFVESQTVTVDGGTSQVDLSDISESISFEVPYTSRPVLPNDPPASVNTETYYIKDVNGTPKSVSKTIQLPVNYVDIHDGDPSDPTTCIGHWHLYNSCELQLNLSAYAKKTDLVTYTNVSELANDVGYIAEADADLKYILRSERNVAGGVAAINDEGHLVLPSGIEIW